MRYGSVLQRSNRRLATRSGNYSREINCSSDLSVGPSRSILLFVMEARAEDLCFAQRNQARVGRNVETVICSQEGNGVSPKHMMTIQ